MAKDDLDDGLDDGLLDDGADDAPLRAAGDIALEVLDEERDPRLRTPEGRADVAIAEAIEIAAVKLTLPEMIYHCDLEMVLIEGEQRARLLGGTILMPTAEQIARIARFASVIKFLTMCHETPATAAEHFAKVARNRNRG